MTPERFNELIAEFTDKEKAILSWKADEYSSDDDRLQNFREVADFIGDKPVVVTPGFVALLYMLKHVQSIKNAVVAERVNWCWEGESGEGLKQRIADSRNYHALMAACLEEESEAEDEALLNVCSCEKKQELCECG